MKPGGENEQGNEAQEAQLLGAGWGPCPPWHGDSPAPRGAPAPQHLGDLQRGDPGASPSPQPHLGTRTPPSTQLRALFGPGSRWDPRRTCHPKGPLPPKPLPQGVGHSLPQKIPQGGQWEMDPSKYGTGSGGHWRCQNLVGSGCPSRRTRGTTSRRWLGMRRGSQGTSPSDPKAGSTHGAERRDPRGVHTGSQTPRAGAGELLQP